MTSPSPQPPLVDPGPELSPAEIGRYSRHLLIPEIGMVGQRRLKSARVLVIGAGGLGAPTLMYLAAAGIGTLGILDFDVVEESNLQRQVIHGQHDIGRSKAESAADSVRELNPYVRTILHCERLTSANALMLFRDYDLVLDGTDNFATRYLVNDACVLLGKPYVWGSIFRFEGQVSVFWAGHGPQYRDLYPVPPPPGSVPSCAEGGVFGVLCATIGSVMGTEAIKLITGTGRSLLGRLLVYDALEMSFRTVPVRPDPAGAPVGELIDYDEFCAGQVSGQNGGASSRSGDSASLGGQATATVDPADFTVSVEELDRRRRSGEDICVVDVREQTEREIVAIPNDTYLPQSRFVDGTALDQLPADRPVILYCKSGGRSGTCLQIAHAAGRTDVRHLAGGVLQWVDVIDPSLPRY